MELQEIKISIYIFIYIVAFLLTGVNMYVLYKQNIQKKYQGLYWMTMIQMIFLGLWVLDGIKMYVEYNYIGEARNDDIPFVLDFFAFLNMLATSAYSFYAYQSSIKSDTSINSKLRSIFISNSVLFFVVALIRLADNKHVLKVYKKLQH